MELFVRAPILYMLGCSALPRPMHESKQIRSNRSTITLLAKSRPACTCTLVEGLQSFCASENWLTCKILILKRLERRKHLPHLFHSSTCLARSKKSAFSRQPAVLAPASASKAFSSLADICFRASTPPARIIRSLTKLRTSADSSAQ